MHGEAAAAHRQDGKSFLQLFDQVRAVGQLGQRVVMGEEADAPVRLLLLLGPAIPCDRRNRESQARQQAQRCGRDQERVGEPVARFRLVDIGRHDSDGFSIDDHGNIRLAKERRQVGRVAFFYVDDRLFQSHGTRRVGAEFGQVDEGNRVAICHELGISFLIENHPAEDLVGFPCGLEECHACSGGLLAGCDLLEISDTFRDVPRPATSRRRRFLIQQIVGGDFHDQPGAADQYAEADNERADSPQKRDVGERFHS